MYYKALLALESSKSDAIRLQEKLAEREAQLELQEKSNKQLKNALKEAKEGKTSRTFCISLTIV